MKIDRDQCHIVYSIVLAEDEKYLDAHRGIAMQQLKELMAQLTAKERLEIYKFLNTVFKCRM